MNNRIAIFASGNGSNAENIIKYFKNSPTGEVVLVLSNSKNAKVLDKATHLSVKTEVFNKQELISPQGVLQKLKEEKVDWIILAGFLLYFPVHIINEFPNRVINIHPALLPKYGGEGMYGMHIHKAVVANKEKETGITIHFVNDIYDEGEIIFQAKTEVLPSDTAETVASKIRQLEQTHFPEVIESLIAEKTQDTRLPGNM